MMILYGSGAPCCISSPAFGGSGSSAVDDRGVDAGFEGVGGGEGEGISVSELGGGASGFSSSLTRFSASGSSSAIVSDVDVEACC